MGSDFLGKFFFRTYSARLKTFYFSFPSRQIRRIEASATYNDINTCAECMTAILFHDVPRRREKDGEKERESEKININY